MNKPEKPTVKGNHPLAEIIAKSMFGLNNVASIYYSKMVSRCARKAVDFHKSEMLRVLEELKSNTTEIISHDGIRFVVVLPKYIDEKIKEIKGE